MKTIKLTAIICFLLGAMVSCNKGNENRSTTTTTDEAADLVTASLSTNSTGSSTNTDDVTASIQAKIAVDSLCGTTWTDSVNRAISFGSSGSYNYKGTHTYTLVCATGSNGLADDSVSTNSVFSGNFSDALLSSAFSGTSHYTVAGLGHGSPTFTVNGEYKRSGAFTIKSDTTFAGTHSIDLILTNVVITKPLRVIQSGTATVTVTGNTLKRGSFTYTGTIVFSGQYNAHLTINGKNYLLNLGTGVRTAL
jgi:hypothetical protein